MSKKNIIIGLIKGYDFEVLRPFLTTLRKTGYHDDVVFFYSQIDPTTLMKLAEWGILLVPFKSSFPYLDEPLAAKNKWRTENQSQELAIHSLRYLLAYCYLKIYGDSYDQVLLTDTRDVLFQKDPFDFIHHDALCCFMEREGTVIADSEVNARWIEKGFGKDELVKLANKPIICSGVSIGSVRRVLEYLEIFMDTIIKRKVPVEITGMDQGVHNYLIYENILPSVEVFSNSTGPVLTLGLEDEVIQKNGIIFNTNKLAPNIVHQYDRHWYIAKKYYSMRFIWRQHVAYARGNLSLFLRRYFSGMYKALISARNAIFP